MSLLIYNRKQYFSNESFDFPCLTITQQIGYFNSAANKIILNNYQYWILAKDPITFTYYIAFLSGMEEKIHGFKLTKSRSNLYNITGLRGLLKKWPDLKPGRYKIITDDIKYEHELDWYPLELIQEK
jgi:hypothetical protein